MRKFKHKKQRKRKNLGSIKHQNVRFLHKLAAFGESKHAAKAQYGGKPPMIYSKETAHTYLSIWVHFGLWAQEHYGIRTMKKARRYVAAYLTMRIEKGLSPSTIHRDASALAKRYQCSSRDFGVKLPPRRRANVSRYKDVEAKMEKLRAEHPELLRCLLSCGLRVHEARLLNTNDVELTKDGRCRIYVRQGKGGRPRYILALDLSVYEAAQQAIREGRDKVFATIPKGTPVHWIRHLFARELYARLARDAHQIPKKDRYICRAEKKGIIYDKRAMRTVSKALGHNRLFVVTHYL